MAVVVGYVATKEGRAALRRAAEECELRHTRLIVINSQRGGKDFDADEAAKFEEELEAIQKKLTDLGLQNEQITTLKQEIRVLADGFTQVIAAMNENTSAVRDGNILTRRSFEGAAV